MAASVSGQEQTAGSTVAMMAGGSLRHIGVVGAGAWGTALAQTMALAGHDVTLWAHEAETVDAIRSRRENRTFLPGIELHPDIEPTGELTEVAACDVVLLVTPAQHLRRIATSLEPHWAHGRPAVICAKGIERETGNLMSEVLREALPSAVPAILSGPSFASDVARGLPTAVTLACADEETGADLAGYMGYRQFRIYWTDDLIGVQLGGAIKNVLAIAAGIVDGCQLGASAHAALVARGFHELNRLAIAMGARPETMMGQSGLGDLILTCGSPQSRNMSLGRDLGRGRTLRQILGERASVTEGVFTTSAVVDLAAQHKVEMPITSAVHEILCGTTTVREAIDALLTRPQKKEL